MNKDNCPHAHQCFGDYCDACWLNGYFDKMELTWFDDEPFYLLIGPPIFNKHGIVKIKLEQTPVGESILKPILKTIFLENVLKKLYNGESYDNLNKH